MPFVAIRQLEKALKSLQRFHPFFGVSFLSMKKDGVNAVSDTIWGSKQEGELLRAAFCPPGAPAKKTYFIPFGRAEKDTGFWRNPKYSGGALQSARTREQYADALEHRTPETWKFREDYVDKLALMLPRDGSKTLRLPVFDLAAWIYRQEELPSTMDAVEKKFRDDFNLDDPIEYAKLFDNSQPDITQFFSTAVISKDELISVTEGVPEGASLAGRSEADLITHLEHWIKTEADLTLPADFVPSFYYALKAQRFVVLAGRPGTGKTAFVRAFHDALNQFFENSVQLVEVSVAQEFSEADVIGYEKISGGHAATELSRRLFLSGRPNDIYVVLLDEMNLAHVDHYLARLLPAFESDAPVELPGEGATKILPSDAFLVGTVNSYLEEATRLPLSGPVKRRANVMEMPNYLGWLVTSGERDEFEKACHGLLKQTKNKIHKRGLDGQASVLDGFRTEGLSTAMKAGSSLRSSELMDPLWEICRVCCSEVSTSPTFGVIQDVLDYVAMSSISASRALSDQVAQKIVPQLNGPARVAKELLTLVEGLDNAAGDYQSARAALETLLKSEDVGTGFVSYSY